jgi:predicted phosphoadenosine phosphosulfate sulfurtransferase
MPPEAEPLPANFPVFPIEDRIGIPNTNPICFPPREFGRVAFMMGIRADESLIRRQAVTRKTEMNYRIQGKGIDKYYPIYDWRTPDVWRAPKIFGWDYNKAYELMEMVGIPHHSQRIAPPYGEQPFKALWMFKVCFPEIWDKMSMRVHGALTAARYAQSPLYGIGAGSVSEADLAQGQTWVEKISEELEKWEPGQKEWVTRRIQSFITSHHNATTDPITFAPHPVSGISWKMLHKIAKNGDFKSRTVPKYITPNTPEAQRIALMKKYEQSLGEKNDD